MLTNQFGKIAEGLFLLGSGQNLMYLVRGRENMLIGGGMSWLAPCLEEQLGSLNVGADDIQYLVIQHAHFDHVGAVPYLQGRFPSMKIVASQRARETLCREKVIRSMDAFNKMMVERKGLRQSYVDMFPDISTINVDVVAGDASVIDLGNGMEIDVIETPGHSPCAISLYIPALKAMFPTDSAPWPVGSIGNLARPSPQFDSRLYKESLRKLLNYEVEICAFEHYAAVLGADARQVLANGLELCSEYEEHVINIYRESGDIEKAARLLEREADGYTHFDFATEELMVPVCRAIIRSILKDAGIQVDGL